MSNRLSVRSLYLNEVRITSARVLLILMGAIAQFSLVTSLWASYRFKMDPKCSASTHSQSHNGTAVSLSVSKMSISSLVPITKGMMPWKVLVSLRYSEVLFIRTNL